MTRVAVPNREAVEVEKRRAFRGQDVADRWAQQGGLCARCMGTISKGFVCDHILPRDLGGATNFANLQLICDDCDAIKTGKDIKRITKARRIRRKLGTDPNIPPRRAKRAIRNQGFRKDIRKRMNGKVERVPS
jgi:5-methylcytosine-specific restriction endonuclease McrA